MACRGVVQQTCLSCCLELLVCYSSTFSIRCSQVEKSAETVLLSFTGVRSARRDEREEFPAIFTHSLNVSLLLLNCLVRISLHNQKLQHFQATRRWILYCPPSSVCLRPYGCVSSSCKSTSSHLPTDWLASSCETCYLKHY